VGVIVIIVDVKDVVALCSVEPLPSGCVAEILGMFGSAGDKLSPWVRGDAVEDRLHVFRDWTVDNDDVFIVSIRLYVNRIAQTFQRISHEGRSDESISHRLSYVVIILPIDSEAILRIFYRSAAFPFNRSLHREGVVRHIERTFVAGRDDR